MARSEGGVGEREMGKVSFSQSCLHSATSIWDTWEGTFWEV